MKEYAGKPDPKYGGIVTNVCELPIGTKFFVYNGGWTGKICQDDIGKYISIEGRSLKRFKDGDEGYLAIQSIEGIHDVTKYKQKEIVVEKINHCSVCKYNNSSACEKCIITSDNALPNHFLADCSKITPFFIDSYYEILNKYIQLLNKSGINYKLDCFDIGD